MTTFPHLLSPVVTEPKKAVVALKWTVRQMEDRYQSMSKLGVRNLAAYNQRIAEAARKKELLKRTVQTGFDADTGQPIYEDQELDLNPLPLIVVVVDEMADLMMVAGKEVEGAIQRLSPNGSRGRHSPDHGDPAPLGGRHHRHDQGEFPDPDQLSGHLQDRQPHDSRRTGRRTAAGPGRHAVYGGRRTR